MSVAQPAEKAREFVMWRRAAEGRTAIEHGAQFGRALSGNARNERER